MKVTLYMAATVNGVIARADDDVSFVSKVNFADFPQEVKRIGNIMVGRRTYELMAEGGEFDKLPPDITVVVLTSKQGFATRKPEHLVAKIPQEALILLEQKGMSEALLAGGGSINASFAEENLIDELYLDIEPWIIGKGIPLFAPGYFEARLKLIEVKKISEDTAQLHYEVVK